MAKICYAIYTLNPSVEKKSCLKEATNHKKQISQKDKIPDTFFSFPVVVKNWFVLSTFEIHKRIIEQNTKKSWKHSSFPKFHGFLLEERRMKRIKDKNLDWQIKKRMGKARSSSEASQVKIFMRDNASRIVIAFALDFSSFSLNITHFQSTALSFFIFFFFFTFPLFYIPEKKKTNGEFLSTSAHWIGWMRIISIFFQFFCCCRDVSSTA